jgi:hypothetical protein
MSDIELRRELRALPAKKRLDRIIERKDAMKVVRSLPVQDLFATIREVGVEDALEVLELASPRQVQAFLDLDGWKADRVDPAAVSTWLRALFSANPERATGQIRGLDIELLTLLFKMHCRVYDLSAEEQPDGDVGLHTITPDNRYLIAYGGIVDDDRMHQVLKTAIERLMGRDLLFVLRLCEAVRWELPSSLEEDAFRWRNARLADLGFLPKHEAMEIYAWRDPDAPLEGKPQIPAAPAEADSPSTDLSTSVLFPWDALADGSAAFARAAGELPPEVRERVAHEVMLIANRVHTADGGDLGDPEALRQTAKSVLDTVGVGLSYRSQGDVTKMAPLLGTSSVSALFRVGHSLGLKIQRELRARINAKDSGLEDNGLLRLDTPLREAAAGLLRPRPMLYGGLVDKKRVDYRPPSSLMELAVLSRAVSEIGFRAALFSSRGFAMNDVKLEALGFGDAPVQPSHGQMLATILARTKLGEEPLCAPVDDVLLARLQKVLGEMDETIGIVAERCRAMAPLPGAPSGDDVVARARIYASQVVDAMRDEMKSVVDPEGRFLSSIWTRHPPPRPELDDDDLS